MKKTAAPIVQLMGIDVLESTIKPTKEYLENQPESKILQIKIDFEQAFKLESEQVRLQINLQLNAVGENDEEIGMNGNFIIRYLFKVAGLETYLEKDGEDIQIQGKFMSTLLSIVISTSRGIIFERTRGSVLNGAPIPIIDTRLLLKMIKPTIQF